jgi:Holliday junction resolvase RusA-like endonuclease
MTFTILGPPRTKKTSNRIFRVRGRPVVMPSAANVSWTNAAVLQLRSQWPPRARFVKVDRERGEITVGNGPIESPLNVCALVYRDANRGDLIGYLQAIADALEAAGVVENDRLVTSWDGSRMFVDKARPRVEIELTPCAPADRA